MSCTRTPLLSDVCSNMINKLLRPVPGRYSLILWKTGRPGTQPVLLIVKLLIAQALAMACSACIGSSKLESRPTSAAEL